MSTTTATGSQGPALSEEGAVTRFLRATELDTPSANAGAAMALEALKDDVLLNEARRRSAFHLCVRALLMTDHVEEAHTAISALREHAIDRGSLRMRVAAARYASDARHCAPPGSS